MEKLKELDIFVSDPSFNVKGSEVISNWKTRILTFLVIVASFGISFSTIVTILTPLSQLPVVSGQCQADQPVDPLVLGIESSIIQDVGTTVLKYQGKVIPKTVCPVQVESSELMECFLTPVVSLGQNNITFTSTASGPLSLYIQTFSLQNILKKGPKLFQSVSFILQPPKIISVSLLQLSISNSVVYKSPKTYTGVMLGSVVNDLPTNQMGVITISNAKTCNQYVVTRLNLLTVITILLSWVRNISGLIGIAAVFNMYALKNQMADHLYQTRWIQSRWSLVRLWLYRVMEALCLEKLLRRYGCFKKEALLSRLFQEVDERLGIQNVMRVSDYLKQEDSGEPADVGQQDQIEFAYDLRDSQGTVSKSQPIHVKFPRHPKPLLSRILQMLNFNWMRVGLISKKSQKSSVCSVIGTVVGIGLMIPLLVYLGAFKKGSTTTVANQLTPKTDFTFGQQCQFHINLYKISESGMQSYYSEGAVSFSLMDEQNNVVQEFQPLYNCTTTLFPPNNSGTYCLPLAKLMSNSSHSDRLGIVFNLPPFPLIAQIRFADYKVEPEAIVYQTSVHSIDLRVPRYYESIITPITVDDNLKTVQGYSLSEFNIVNQNFATVSTATIVIRLSRSSMMLTIRNNSVIRFLQRIWAVNYLLFSVLATMIIIPYNNRVVKLNLLSKFRYRQGVGDSQSLLSLNNLTGLLYSALNRCEGSFPYVKSRLQCQ